MNTFPIILSEKVTSTHDDFYPEHALPLFQYGKKLYIEYDGKIRAAIPLYSAFVNVPGGAYGWRTTNLTGFKIAGIGKKDLECDMHINSQEKRIVCGYSFPRLFLTIDDYDRFINGNGGTYMPDGVSVPDILRANGYDSFCEAGTWTKGIVGWIFHNSEATNHTMPFCDMYVDADGGHVTVLRRGTGWAAQKKAYLTREECLAANRKPVEEFDESETEPERIMDETNGHERELVRRINDAWNKRREEFAPIMRALYIRDRAEIFNSDAFSDLPDYYEIAANELDAHWDKYAGTYLQEIADNNDLSTILHFLNYGNR